MLKFALGNVNGYGYAGMGALILFYVCYGFVTVGAVVGLNADTLPRAVRVVVPLGKVVVHFLFPCIAAARYALRSSSRELILSNMVRTSYLFLVFGVFLCCYYIISKSTYKSKRNSAQNISRLISGIV